MEDKNVKTKNKVQGAQKMYYWKAIFFWKKQLQISWLTFCFLQRKHFLKVEPNTTHVATQHKHLLVIAFAGHNILTTLAIWRFQTVIILGFARIIFELL